jgi:hypothetical protein
MRSEAVQAAVIWAQERWLREQLSQSELLPTNTL